MLKVTKNIPFLLNFVRYRSLARSEKLKITICDNNFATTNTRKRPFKHCLTEFMYHNSHCVRMIH